MSLLGDLWDSITGNVGNIAAGATGLAATNAAINQGKGDLQAIQNDLMTRSGVTSGGQSLAEQITGGTTFKPFTVTSGAGTGTFDNQGLTLSQDPNQQALQQQAAGMMGGLGQGVAGLGSTGSQAFNQAQQAMNAQSGLGMTAQGGLYSTLGQNQIGNAQSPAELQRLQTAMTTQGLTASGQPSQGLLGLQGLTGQANFQGSGADVTGAFSGIAGSPFQTNTAQAVQNQAMQGVGQAGQYADVSGAFAGVDAPDVRTGAGEFSGGLLSQAQQALQGDTPTAESLFEQIRATQTPEEERQRIALENRLAAQGRLGVNTAAYGGTPEQLAMEKAQAEARNNASLQAIGMADQLASSQQARAAQLGQLGLSGEQIQAQLDSEGFGQAMQLGQADLQSAQTQSALQSEAQNRANQLRQMGLSAEQVQNQLLSEGFGQEMQLAQAGIGAQQAQSDLENAAQARASQLAQLGMSAEQIASQLQSEGLSRQQSSAQLAGQLAQTGAGISAQEQQLGQGLLGLGLQAQELGGQLGMQDLARAQGMFGLGQQASMLPSQLESQQLANVTQALSAAGIPLQQQLSMLQPALQQAQLQQAGQLSGINALSQLGSAELGMLKELGLGSATLDAELLRAIGNIFTGGGSQ
jgi:hypothetical protein